MYKDLQLPSDFLIDNHKSLSKRNDYEDLCESLDDLQHEAMNLAFQDGFKSIPKDWVDCLVWSKEIVDEVDLLYTTGSEGDK